MLDTVMTNDKSEAVSKLMKLWESKNAKRALRGAGLSTMALSLAACGSDSDPVADAGGDDALTAALAQIEELQAALAPTVVVASGVLAQPKTVAETYSVAAAGGGNFAIAAFDTAEDTLHIEGLADAAGATLDELVGDAGLGGEVIAVQENPFDGSLVINLGFDSEGEVVTITLNGLTAADIANVKVSLAEAAVEAPADGGDAPADGGDAPADGGDAPADGGDAPADGGDAPADGGDAPADGGDAPAAEEVAIVDGEAVAGQDGVAENFTVSAAAGGNLDIAGFNTAEDTLTLTGLGDLVGDTLADIVGETGLGGEAIAVQENPFTGSLFVNLGVDAEGEVVSLNLGGLTADDLSAISIVV